MITQADFDTFRENLFVTVYALAKAEDQEGLEKLLLDKNNTIFIRSKMVRIVFIITVMLRYPMP